MSALAVKFPCAGRAKVGRRFFILLRAAALFLPAFSLQAAPSTITNLMQLARAVESEPHLVGSVHLTATVCAASRPELGVVAVQDDSGLEMLELGPQTQALAPGDRIEIQEPHALLRRRDLGVKISAVPVVDNDGVHSQTNRSGTVWLEAGRHPLELDWFNQFRDLDLEVTCAFGNGAPEKISAASLWQAVTDPSSGRTVFRPGLRVNCYEGFWNDVPDFELLPPVKTGVVTNFDLQFRTQDEMVGLQFTGFFDAPHTGRYTFATASDDGSLLFLGNPSVPVTRRGTAPVPAPEPAIIGQPLSSLAMRRWVVVEGTVRFVRPAGRGLELELRSERDSLEVRMADAEGLNPAALLNERVRVTGVGCGVFNLDQRIILGQLLAASGRELEMLGTPPGATPLPLPLVTAQQVQTLPLPDARRSLPVRLRGVVTSVGPPYDYWLSIQDETRGIFVDIHALTNAAPVPGEFWEIIGHSGAGDFAPIVVADRGIRLGKGRLPEPVHPAWNELINGSLDVQWVEFQGLVTEVHSNTLSLLLADGQIAVQMEGHYESELKRFEKAVVRIRGVLYAAWKTGTRELLVGTILMRNASINVDTPAPADPFDAVVKTPRELLLFDAQATAFRRVKVRGQIIHASASRLFLMEDGTGLRVLPAGPVKVHPGDRVEAVGYPEINPGGNGSLLLREALVRQTGAAPLPPPRILSENNLTQAGLDSTRVRVEGKLLGWHTEQGAPVLEMQSGGHLFLARLDASDNRSLTLRAGSRLALDGVYVGQGRPPRAGAEPASFELLLNSPADIHVLSEPSWWTLQRLLVLVSVLLIILAFTAIWITQLHRLVEQRTAQLQHEIRQREYVERQHALEAERSRIARDLHDDLGSSLTEISVLASAGQRPLPDENQVAALFQTIAAKARSLIAALDGIVWAVDPEDNSLQSLADYLSGYVEEFFSHTPISCRFKVPLSFPPITVEGRVRHDLLMAVKETVNNIARHAEATEAEFRLTVSDNTLEITITDNGKGFAGDEHNGHGLKNLPARLKNAGGECTIASCVGGGTTVKIRLPLTLAKSSVAAG